MSYSRLSQALRRWWFVVLGFVVLGLGAGLVYLQAAPAQYTAKADVIVMVRGANAVDLSSGANFAQQQARNLGALATRQAVLDPVVRRFALPDSASGLAAHVSATVPTDTSIVTLQVTYPSAQQATSIANAVADSLATQAIQLMPTQTSSNVVLREVYQVTPPGAPSSPSTVTALLLGVFGGLAVGVAAVLALELLRPSRPGAEQARPDLAAVAAAG